ncbi:MAG: hypothetical protein ACLP6G_10460 [Terriglobales bacterium]
MQTKTPAEPSNFFILFVLSLTLAGGSTAQVKDEHGKRTSSWQVWLAQEHVISRWEDISVVQIDNQLFIQSEKGDRTHLYTDKKQHCPSRATLLNRTRVFIEGCTSTFVADLSGAVQYKFHRFWYFEIAPNRTGTRFAVFERGRSSWHELADGSYDKLRLLVYSTEDGKKLFERKWSQAAGEMVTGAQIALSDDGSTLCLHQNQTTTFSIPPVDLH